jgi:hypothetical protein
LANPNNGSSNWSSLGSINALSNTWTDTEISP